MTAETNPRVLMIGPSLQSRGGMATVENQLIRALRRNGTTIEFISSYDDGCVLKRTIIGLSAYLIYLCRIHSFDVVHLHMASRGSCLRKALFAKVALRAGKKVVIHLHGGGFLDWFDKGVSKFIKQKIVNFMNSASAIVVLSEEWVEWMAARGFDRQKLTVIYNSVPMPEAACHPDNGNNILFLGRLDDNKSPDVLIRAASRVIDSFPRVGLVFAGDGSYEQYEALSDELGIRDKCTFLGWVTGDEKEELFEKAAFLCLPSKNEGMPMSILESMAHGVPVIATSVGGIPQVVVNGWNGFLMHVGDVEELSILLEKLLSSPSVRRQLGANGREMATKKFDLECNVRKLDHLYRSIVTE